MAAIAATAFLAAAALAADNADKGVTGTWTSTFKGRNNRTITSTYTFKQDGAKLTGTVSGPGGRMADIKEGTIKDGKVAFQVTFEGMNGQEFTIHYKGTLKGDTITGKSQFEINGEKRDRDWKATRGKTKK